MEILTSTGWGDYSLIDSGNGYRLERFGEYVLSRPDPQIIWKKRLSDDIWNKADAAFVRTYEDKGRWNIRTSVPDKWLLHYNDLSFFAKLTPFKHTGIFPEQHLHWDFIRQKLETRSLTLDKNTGKSKLENQTSSLHLQSLSSNLQHPTSTPNILNLFGYTGIASIAAAASGARVTHIDASKPTIGWARDNQEASGLTNKPIRWINDDAMKFVEREVKRGVKYDGIIMDPPVFGHGPDGSLWKFNESFPRLLEICRQVLSDTPLFVIVNAYAISSSSFMLQNVMNDYFGNLGGAITSGELTLKEESSDRQLSTGIFSRWSHL